MTFLKSSEDIVIKLLNDQLKNEGYKVLNAISSGGQGRVYKLIDQNKKFACIKIQSLEDSMIDNEVETLQKLHQ